MAEDQYLRHQMPGWAGEELAFPEMKDECPHGLPMYPTCEFCVAMGVPYRETKPPCEHMRFLSEAKVVRLTDNSGVVTGYTVDIRIKCDDCGLPFRFLGLAAGSHYAEPRVSADALELRAPLEPAYVTEILGQPRVSGRG